MMDVMNEWMNERKKGNEGCKERRDLGVRIRNKMRHQKCHRYAHE